MSWTPQNSKYSFCWSTINHHYISKHEPSSTKHSPTYLLSTHRPSLANHELTWAISDCCTLHNEHGLDTGRETTAQPCLSKAPGIAIAALCSLATPCCCCPKKVVLFAEFYPQSGLLSQSHHRNIHSNYRTVDVIELMYVCFLPWDDDTEGVNTDYISGHAACHNCPTGTVCTLHKITKQQVILCAHYFFGNYYRRVYVPKLGNQ